MKDHTAVLIDHYFGRDGGELRLGGHPVTRLAAQFGTPLFIYDASVLQRKWQILRGLEKTTGRKLESHQRFMECR